MKIQPVDFEIGEATVVAVTKSRLKRLFERQFSSMLRIPSLERMPSLEKSCCEDAMVEFDPSSVFLGKMVRNYLEECEKHPAGGRCGGKNRCRCFSGNMTDSSDDEVDFFCGYGNKNSDCKCSLEALKVLVLCACVSEKILSADVARIVEKQRACKRKDFSPAAGLPAVVDELAAVGYDATACKCRWEKSLSTPAGEYEFINVVIQGERVIVDIDFLSQFEIARPTKKYKSILGTLPTIFVGKEDRLRKIVATVSEAAKQSLRKRGMPVPPWRKTEYIMAKWFSDPIAHHPATSEDEELTVSEGAEEGVFLDPLPLVFAKAKPKSMQMGVERVSGLTSVIEA
ncbi:hypothetical protein MLD38_031834 [Melastoma candidum]|uniref:Uncharacterized protein n=1 Tax=Melastoma candidum TaxID=119954 RepID=A0ACB9MQX9_9MYRT|nr:hypothetical protein MLD38_031834 [Melastoma candidum]